MLAQQCSALLSQPEIPVSKHTKSGMIHFDLKPYLAETSFTVEENTVRISAFLPAGSEKKHFTLFADGCIGAPAGSLFPVRSGPHRFVRCGAQNYSNKPVICLWRKNAFCGIIYKHFRYRWPASGGLMPGYAVTLKRTVLCQREDTKGMNV